VSDVLTLTNNKPSKNALKHAVYSKDVVLDWEDKLEFEALHHGFREFFEAEGALMDEAVFELASLHWKKRRLNIGSKLAFHRQSGSEKLTEASKGGWEGVAEHLSKSAAHTDQLTDDVRAMAKGHATATRTLYDQVVKHVTEVVFPSAPSAGPEKEQIDIERLITLAKQLKIVGAEVVVPMMHAIESDHFRPNVEQAYRPDILEKELKLHAEISRQIEKVVKRLVMLQEYKRLYSRKSIEAK
jgi:hypothetical protein